MRPRLLLAAALLVLLPVVACGGDDDDDRATATDGTAVATTPPPTTDDAPATTEGAPAEDAVVHLADTGLVAGDIDVPFGTARAATVDALAAVLGDPTEEGQEDECPAGETFYVRYGEGPEGISLDFQADLFVGWSIGFESALATTAGVGIGSSRVDLEAEHGPVEIYADSTIGIEFTAAGGMSGLLDEDAPDGLVTALWAGTTCIYR